MPAVWGAGRLDHGPCCGVTSPHGGDTLPTGWVHAQEQPHRLRGYPHSRCRRLLPRGVAGVSSLGNLEVFARVVGRSPLAANSSAQENSPICAPGSWSSCPGPGAAAARPWSSLTAHGPMPGSAVFFSSLTVEGWGSPGALSGKRLPLVLGSWDQALTPSPRACWRVVPLLG